MRPLGQRKRKRVEKARAAAGRVLKKGGKLPELKAKELIVALKKLGFDVVRQRGSHLRMTNKGKGCDHNATTIPNHPSTTVNPNLVHEILKQTGVTREALLAVL